MSDLKRHLISAGLTFVGTFITTFITVVSVGGFTFSKETIFATLAGALITAGRAVVKIVYEIGVDLIKKAKTV